MVGLVDVLCGEREWSEVELIVGQKVSSYKVLPFFSLDQLS